jgi:hypothetical protein
MAGARYARDLREGHGHVATLRAEFRTLSRNWHTCLGFGLSSYLMMGLIPRQI